MTISKIIGNFLRHKRIEKGYSQFYVSYCLNISQNAYSKIELGISKITITRLIDVAKIMDFHVLEVIDFIDSYKDEVRVKLNK